jgi:hypothetical protein
MKEFFYHQLYGKRQLYNKEADCKLRKTCKTHPRHSTAITDQSLSLLAKYFQ